jgi:prepilin-type N-terminal cleavage/methylation domain-containing protein
MRRGTAARNGERGFTLIELMVATTLMTVLVAMTLQLAFTMVEGFRTQRTALAIERNARGSIDFLAVAVRGASTGVVTGELRDAAGCTDTAAISVVNASDGPDRLSVIYALPGALTSTRETVSVGTSQFEVADAAGLAEGDAIILTNTDLGRVIPVTAVTGDRITTTPTTCTGLSFPDFPPGSLVVRARVAVFYVEAAADGTPMLMMDPDGDGDRTPEPIAEGIEDLQVSIGVDVDRDGILTDNGDTADEWFYNAEGDADPPPITGGGWRALRLTVIARDLAAGTARSARAAAEDHAAGTEDGHRRRILTTTAEIRNFVQGIQ